LLEFEGDAKNFQCSSQSYKAKAKVWTFEAKAIGPEAKAKATKIGLEAKVWP